MIRLLEAKFEFDDCIGKFKAREDRPKSCVLNELPTPTLEEIKRKVEEAIRYNLRKKPKE